LKEKVEEDKEERRIKHEALRECSTHTHSDWSKDDSSQMHGPPPVMMSGLDTNLADSNTGCNLGFLG